jgi:hypothetical protein
MTHPPTSFNRTRAARVTTAAATLIFVVSMIMVRPAEARGGHGFHHGFGEHGIRGGEFAGDRRQSYDAHMKAASQEEDKPLNSKIRSIYRGC